MTSEAPTEGSAVVLRYPPPEVFICPFCYAGNATAQMKGNGVYKLHGSLAKHLKLHHPSSFLKWVCSECSFTDSGACPFKAVKLHFERTHASGQSTLRLQRAAATTTTTTTTTTTAAAGRTTPAPHSISPSSSPEFEADRTRPRTRTTATTTTTTARAKRAEATAKRTTTARKEPSSRKNPEPPKSPPTTAATTGVARTAASAANNFKQQDYSNSKTTPRDAGDERATTRASAALGRATSCPPAPPTFKRTSGGSPATTRTTRGRASPAGTAPSRCTPPSSSSKGDSGRTRTTTPTTTTTGTRISPTAGRRLPAKPRATTTAGGAGMTTRASAARRRASSCPPTPPITKQRRSAPRTSPSTSATTTTTTATSRRTAALRAGTIAAKTSPTPVVGKSPSPTATSTPSPRPFQRRLATPTTTFAEAAKGVAHTITATPQHSPVAVALTTATCTTTTGGRPISSPAIVPSNYGLLPVTMPCTPPPNVCGGASSPPSVVASTTTTTTAPPSARTPPLVRPSGTPLATIVEDPVTTASPVRRPSTPLENRREEPANPSPGGEEEEDSWSVVQGRRRRTDQQQRQQQQQQQQQQQHRDAQQRQERLPPQRRIRPPAGTARSDAGSAGRNPRLILNNAGACAIRANVRQSSARPGTAQGCTCRCRCGASFASAIAYDERRGGTERARVALPFRSSDEDNNSNSNSNNNNVAERVQDSSSTRRGPPRTGTGHRGGAGQLPGPSATQATPQRGRRRNGGGTRLEGRGQIGARNPPPTENDHNSRGDSRGAASGASLSARVVAARTRAGLVEDATAARNTDDLEAVAARVAQLFPARRVGGAHAGAENNRGATGGRPQSASRTARPEQRSSSQVSREEYKREATRIQKMYRANRKRAVGEILHKDSPFCELPKDTIQRHFAETFARTEGAGPLPQPQETVEPSTESNDALVSPLERIEVLRRLRRMKNSSPGPDGVTYEDLRRADPDAAVLTALYNACLRLGHIPREWKQSHIVLLHKKGSRDDLRNWRPIAMGDVVVKLLAAVLADRLTRWASDNDRLSAAQKGFLRHEGCLEHSFMLHRALERARDLKQQAVVAWLDLADAFGSVPHAVIRNTLVAAGVPGLIIKTVESLYEGATVRVRTREGYTDPIPMQSGVRQGCPLSPILFNLVIDPLVRAAAESGAGLDVFGERVTALAYADDIALVAATPGDMQRLLSSAENSARPLGLAFNPRKCATLHVGAKGEPIPTAFHLAGESLPVLEQGDSYLHLGVPTGVGIDQTPYRAITDLVADLEAVSASLLAPWQKIETVATFLLPRLDFLLRGGSVKKSPLAEADRIVRRTVKGWLNLPQRASAEVVYIPPSWGGCGLLPLADLADASAVAHAFKLLNADDPAVARVARSTLENAVRLKIRRVPTEEDIAGYLSGSLEGELALPSSSRATFWSRVRSAALRSSKRLAIRWVWSQARCELSLECLARGGRRVTIPPAAKRQVIGRLRAAVSAHHMSVLLGKPDQGKVLDATSRHGASNRFMRTGQYLRFADWRFIHRARLDVLPLNGARRWGDGDKRCRKCGYQSETLPHVLCHCGPHSAARQLRHNAIVERLAAASRLPGGVRLNQCVPGVDGDLAALRPDLVVTHEPSGTVVMIDVTVAFENRSEALEKARIEKIHKYRPLANALTRSGRVVHVDGFVVGALGAWHPNNDNICKLLRISPRYASLMRKLMVSETIAWSRDVYVEHVSGIRQYCVQGLAAPGAAPSASTPARANISAVNAHATGSETGAAQQLHSNPPPP